jgi:hypothetical protein
MEIPYRNSTAESEEQHSSIAAPSGSPPVIVGTTNSSVPASPTKFPAMASTVVNIINRNRQRSLRRPFYDEMKSSLRRRSSNEVPRTEEVPLNNNSPSENSNDYRVTVV